MSHLKGKFFHHLFDKNFPPPSREWCTFFFIFIFFLLTSCSTTPKDGPPGYNVDVSQIHDAVPKVEPLSKYGNKPVYEVFGKKYNVMVSSKNYKETGTASWYGTKFHRRNTSSGEPYDMLAMTAAHKSLPLPTYVEVKNLSNGKKVIVKVNDRGPFVGNRLIDLSYAAAKKLGITGTGTGRVEIRAIDPGATEIDLAAHEPIFAKNTIKPKATKKTTTILVKNTSTKKHAPIYLQVGAFQNKVYAEKLKKQLSGVVASPVKITELVRAKKLYRVQIGPLNDSNKIAEINKQLKSIGLNSREMMG